MFKVGDKIFTCELKDPSTYREYTVTKVGKDTIQCGSSENTMYSAFCWPLSCKDQFLEIVRETARLQKIVDDRIKLIFELRNELVRSSLGHKK